jgi:hypothetical protein
MTDIAKTKITFKCSKCGKTAPVDKEKSTRNWIVYKTKEPCECGGKFVPTFDNGDSDAKV